MVTTATTRYRATCLCSADSENGSVVTGGIFYAVAVSGGSPIGNNCGLFLIDGFLARVLFITLTFALTPESKGGAVCGHFACTDLCGGRSAMVVPTVTPSADSMARIPGARAQLASRSRNPGAKALNLGSLGACVREDLMNLLIERNRLG
jgi:hypothetical protein